MTYVTWERNGMGESEPIDEDELVSKRKIAMQETLRDAETTRCGRGDLQR